MALEKSKKVMIEGKCVVDGKPIKGFRAILDLDDPNCKMTRHPYEIDPEACKTYRKEVRKAEQEFDDYAYDEQDKFIMAVAK